MIQPAVDELQPRARGFRSSWETLTRALKSLLRPLSEPPKAWLYVCELGRLAPGQSLTYLTPAGATVNVARRGSAAESASFLAVSSVCPHVGCQLRWESTNGHFSCPCRGFEPPATPPHLLLRYPVKLEDGVLYIEAPLERRGPSL
jgi:Rieske Fe-S protein